MFFKKIKLLSPDLIERIHKEVRDNNQPRVNQFSDVVSKLFRKSK